MQATDLHAVRQPVSIAKGLPNAHYIDPAVYEKEKQAFLFDQWVGLGVAADVPTPIDPVPLTFFLSLPLLLQRDKDGWVRVFHNNSRTVL